MKKLTELLKECQQSVGELFPWDLEEKLIAGNTPLLLDVREADEFAAMHIENSINVPRGVLETACEWGYDETIPDLVNARDKEVIVICRAGNRSLLAALTMQIMGYQNVTSLQTGLRGWNDNEQTLVNDKGEIVSIDDADEFFTSKVRAEQMAPK